MAVQRDRFLARDLRETVVRKPREGNAVCLPHDVGVGRKDPGAVLPRLERVLSKPARDRRRRDVGDATLDDKPMQLSA